MNVELMAHGYSNGLVGLFGGESMIHSFVNMLFWLKI
jgi:MFS superfamily sulfate permease-like transporter